MDYARIHASRACSGESDFRHSDLPLPRWTDHLTGRDVRYPLFDEPPTAQ
jgi:hypothetical protein